MCFGKSWSATSLSVLVGSAIFCAYHKVDWRIVVSVLFLAWKELIQLLLYYNLENCNDANKLLTVMAWIHISFQPFFVLLIISAFSKKSRLYGIPLFLALVFAIFNCIRIKEFNPIESNMCLNHTPSKSICRPKTCSVQGEYHVAYGFELTSTDSSSYVPNLFTYYLLSFAVPFFIGDWQLAAIHASVAIISKLFIKNDVGEAAAVWCVNTFWIGLVAVYYALYGNPFN